MNKFAIGAALASLSLALPAAAVAQRNAAPQILVVDTVRIFNECNACRAAQTQLQTQVTQLQQRRQQIAQQLQTTGQPIQTAITALNGRQPDAALSARIQAFENQQNQANQELQGRGNTLQSTEAHVNQQIGTRLGPIIEQIRATRNAAVVVARNNTLANNPSLDVTNEALAQLNQQLPTVSVTPLPQQQPAPGQPAQPQPPGR